jgi:hypothetical protein
MDLKNRVRRCWLGSTGSKHELEARGCKYGNESSDSIKGGNFLRKVLICPLKIPPFSIYNNQKFPNLPQNTLKQRELEIHCCESVTMKT